MNEYRTIRIMCVGFGALCLVFSIIDRTSPMSFHFWGIVGGASVFISGILSIYSQRKIKKEKYG